jgi:NAD+ diphosphatase
MPRESIYKQYIPENRPTYNISDKSYWFIFNSSKMLTDVENSFGNSGISAIPFLENLEDLGIVSQRKIYLGKLQDHPCYAVEVSNDMADDDVVKGMLFQNLIPLYSILDEDIFLLAGKAIQLLNWDKNHQFCGKCGTSTHTKDDQMAKICPECGFTSFTRLSPAVITAIIKDGKLLMARNTYSHPNRYGLIAGFLEAGETLEEAVQRETAEEVGLKVKNIRYFGSQPWPFPNSLMIAFTAEYESGTINVDENEISDASWFDADKLPRIPPKASITRELIDWYMENYTA